jgi:mono/diheme cytochrome c family protein
VLQARSGVAVVLVPWAAAAAAAAASPDPQVRRGKEVAQLQCSACHVVAERQKYPPLLEDPAPSFQSIANRPQTSKAALRRFVATTHWDQQTASITMPNPGLSKTDIAAVSRYILSLKGR